MKIIKNILFVFVLTVALTACLGDSDVEKTPSQIANPPTGNQKHKLTILQFKIEIVREMEELANAYEAEHPDVEIEMQTVAGKDYPGVLKYLIASNNPPDIFNNFGDRGLDTWIEILEDLSDQPWVSSLKDSLAEPISIDGHIYGLPYNIEGYGYLYNKDIFEKCNIEKLPNSFEELEDVTKTLKSKGYTPFYSAYQENWVLTNHYLNTALANESDPDLFLKEVLAGKQKFNDSVLMNRWLDLLEFEMENSQGKAFMSDYNQQLIAFANGEVAMIQQGNWVQGQLDALNPDMRIGLFPIPILEEKTNSIPVGVAAYWVVNKNSAEKELAKDFLNWMVTSETGKNFMLDKLKFIPPLTTIEVEEGRLGQISDEVMRYIDSGNTYGWAWYKLPEYYSMELYNRLKPYLEKDISREAFFEEAEQLLIEMN